MATLLLVYAESINANIVIIFPAAQKTMGTVDTHLLPALTAPMKITNIWGKSGAGKTIIAINLAVAELARGGKVLYFSDEPGDFAMKLAKILNGDNDSRFPRTFKHGNLTAVEIKNFKNQEEIVRNLPFAFLPGQEAASSKAFKDFIGAAETNLNGRVIESLEAHYKPPTMLVLDEFTRQYRRQAFLSQEPGDLGQDMAAQLGCLKTIALDRQVKIVLTNASKTIIGIADDSKESKFIEVPVANNLFEYYADIDVQITWTQRAGERALTILNQTERGKPGRVYIDLASLYIKKEEV